MSLSTGTRLGPYEILASIGAGGMGEVYSARDTRLDRFVAIKVSKTDLDQHVQSGRPSGNDEIEFSVSVQIRRLNPIRGSRQRVGLHGGERAVAFAEKDGKSLGAGCHNGHVWVAIAVEIANDAEPGAVACRRHDLRLECSVAVAEQHRYVA